MSTWRDFDDSVFCMSKVFPPWKTDENWLLPPSVSDFVPAGHPAHFIRDLVSEELDLSAIMGVYTEVKGCPTLRPHRYGEATKMAAIQ
jgi:hypothetical protein